MNICNKCGIGKDISCFDYRTDSKKLRNKCKDCDKKDRKEYRDNPINKKRVSEQKKQSYIKRSEYYRKKSLDFYNKNKSDIIAKRYGITTEEYNELFTSSEFRCNICGIHHEECNKGLHVDHCHITNKVRGLLCNECNTGIGKLKDNIEIMKKAIKYLGGNNESV